MAGVEGAAEIPSIANTTQASKKKTSATKSKPKAQTTRKRSLKVEGVGDGPPKKKARTAGKKSVPVPTSTAMDVDRDLMDVIAADDDANDELGLAIETPSLENRRVSSHHHEPLLDAQNDDEVLDLEAALMDSGHPSKGSPRTTNLEPDLDVDAELLKAIGDEEDTAPFDQLDAVKADAATPSLSRNSPAPERHTSTEPSASGNSKRPRESSPPPGSSILPEPSEILSTGRVRKKTKTPYAMATEQLAQLDDLIPLPPPTKSRKRSGKGKNAGEKDSAYHSSTRLKPGGHPRPSKPKTAKVPEPPLHSLQAEDDGAAMVTEELGLKESGPGTELETPPAAAPTPPAPQPRTFRKPQRPRIPTIDEATPDSPPPPEVAELVTQPIAGDDSAELVALDRLTVDDEELFFLKIGLAARRGDHSIPYVRREVPPPPIDVTKAQLRVHRTGSSRSEGYYKIPEALKSTYLPQRNRAMVLDEPNTARANAEAANAVTAAATAASASSRSNRINTRRLVQGMEQANKAMGDTQSTQLQFNQLRARKKQLIFSRSPIHDWGLYAMEAIPQGEMVIEYVGEVIRAQVADKREKWYEKVGIGSSYLFRVDEDSVVDATKRGNLGRLINHSCTPNCTAKIIVVNSQKKIVIYAKTSIEPGEEITYGS
ncbi:histone methyltransferase set1 [Tulasnella sp. 427]|nr:histone methyltransferase set1 [Tulasnella sp. 427]